MISKVSKFYVNLHLSQLVVNTLDVHPQGDYILVGCANGKLYWYNIEQSSNAERTLSFNYGVISVEFHKTLSIFLY